MTTKTFKYPEVVHNHFQNCHSVNDHNAKRHSPLIIAVVWATKHMCLPSPLQSQKSTAFCQNLTSPAESMTA